jgi:cytidine deaminase
MNKTLNINYQEFNHYIEIGAEVEKLVELAYKSADKAYAPYSNFHVGALVQFTDNEYIIGNNQENIAYPSGLCAERVALFYAGANFPQKEIKRIVIVAKGDLISKDDCLSPCGSCRQVIAESERRQNAPIEICLISASGRTFIFSSIKDLLIFPFGI